MNHYSKGTIRGLAIFAISVFFVMLACLILVFSGKATLSFSGFAVDEAGRLYIGTKKAIRIYEEGLLVNSISPHTSRAYVFTIREDDMILLSTSTKVYVMNLEGEIIEVRDDPGADTYNQISYRKREFISQNGDIYKCISILGWSGIVKNGHKIVYQTDMLSFFVKYLIVISALALFLFPIWALSAHLPKYDNNTN